MTIKADDKVKFEGTPEKFTHFEELCKRVEVLQEAIDEHAEILRANDLVRNEEILAPYFDEDEVFNKLEEDDETTN